tara:strand:- start:1936 stop:2142 length:207 start_codon:yes stop_codon:yes gene_type:complete
MAIGPWQIIIVLAILLLLFGPSRLPNLGKSIGQAIRGFKKGISEDEIDVTDGRKEIDQDEKQNEEKKS